MTIEISCPSCSATYQVRDELAGRAAKCKKCGAKVPIPAKQEPDDTDELRLAPETADTGELRLASDNVPDTGELRLAGDETPAVDEMRLAGDAPSGGAEGSAENCPMCGTPLLPDADMCVGCGFNLHGEPDAAPTPDIMPEGMSERAEELLADTETLAAARRGAQIARYSLMLVVLVVICGAGWWVWRAIAASQRVGRIETLVESVVQGKTPPPDAAAKLAEDLPALPVYLESLAEKATSVKAKNLNLGELEYFDEPGSFPKYRIKYSGRFFDATTSLSKDVPTAWKKATVISTMIVNLPEDCDILPLLQINDAIGLPPATRLVGARTDLDWQIEKSCDADEKVRRFAAHLLLDRLKTEAAEAAAPDPAALESLAKPTTVAEKKTVFEQLRGG